jgi:polo-like kinase 1
MIHHGLKLRNLFQVLDSDMNDKVGNFDLVALIESPGEWQKSICSMPNYIAPEVLFDAANGCSFEVHIWLIIIILYILIITCCPPFQIKDVNKVYQ